MPGYADVFGLAADQQAKDYSVEEIAVFAGQSTGVNSVLPGESISLTFRFKNRTSHPMEANGEMELISYATKVPAGEVWKPQVSRIAKEGSTPFHLNLAPGGTQDVVVVPQVPERFGGYVLVSDVEGRGRSFAAALARSISPDNGRVQFPTYALDATWPQFMNEKVFTLFERLGVKAMRLPASYAPASAPEAATLERDLDAYMGWAKTHDVAVMLTLQNGSTVTQPLGRPRPWLSPEGTMLKSKSDEAWLPQYDPDFQNWVERLAMRYGWPSGNLNAVELWNEPWESTSISGWGADIPRYREIYTSMAQGVEAARKKAGVQVLIGGTCSSSNARDKLFADGSDQFLKWLDFVSVHYQPLAADATEEPAWRNRKSPYGPVRVWDTESWIANSEDRFPAVIASMRAQGLTRTAGIYAGNVYDSHNLVVDGKPVSIVQVWAPAAAVAATQKFIGQRDFERLLFANGLPWVFTFRGLPGAAKPEEDGTLVVLGDLKALYDPNRTVFRSVHIASDAHLVLHDSEHRLRAFDSNGNAMPALNGVLTVPLNGSGYFLRGDGRNGSFAALLAAVRSAEIHGIDPVEIVAHDMTTPLGAGSSFRLTLTNVLNHPIDANVSARLTNLSLPLDTQRVRLVANETRTVTFSLPPETPLPQNVYPLEASVDAGAEGTATLHEDLHVNRIAYRTISVDGNLQDWVGVLPQILPGTGIGANLTEEAWLPYRDFTQGAGSNLATAYLAYDDQFFYFAAKIADTTPDAGMLRFAKRDDDSYFYPTHVQAPDGTPLTWPENVRHFSYRKHFDVPSGSGEHDNVQIAFNVLPAKPLLPHPPGVMPHFITYWDTDYEFALNTVAQEYGGGTEIWRLQAPGIPRKHFFPRQPHSPIDGGPVDGKLVTRYENGTRIVEAAIPWSAMPEVYARIQRGETIKFTCRVNDNKGPAHELATGRSVSTTNSFTFHDDWKTHWSNELEFSADRNGATSTSIQEKQ
ncbi:hypothetical protein GCM10011586_23270 [Silvibacterium dinghuense]|nr:hypothetical protein GCM10011586_23270 [Silvibacterium dinghuense]